MIYDYAEIFSDGLANISIFDKQGFVDLKGKELLVKSKDFERNTAGFSARLK